MTTRPTPPAQIAASVALFGVILVVSVLLALGTELHIAVRGAIALGAGLAAALITFLVVGRVIRGRRES